MADAPKKSRSLWEAWAALTPEERAERTAAGERFLVRCLEVVREHQYREEPTDEGGSFLLDVQSANLVVRTAERFEDPEKRACFLGRGDPRLIVSLAVRLMPSR